MISLFIYQLFCLRADVCVGSKQAAAAEKIKSVVLLIIFARGLPVCSHTHRRLPSTRGSCETLIAGPQEVNIKRFFHTCCSVGLLRAPSHIHAQAFAISLMASRCRDYSAILIRACIARNSFWRLLKAELFPPRRPTIISAKLFVPNVHCTTAPEKIIFPYFPIPRKLCCCAPIAQQVTGRAKKRVASAFCAAPGDCKARQRPEPHFHAHFLSARPPDMQPRCGKVSVGAHKCQFDFFSFFLDFTTTQILGSQMGIFFSSLLIGTTFLCRKIERFNAYLWWHLRHLSHNPLELSIAFGFLLIQQRNFFRKFSRICHLFLFLATNTPLNFPLKIFSLFSHPKFVTVYAWKHINSI